MDTLEDTKNSSLGFFKYVFRFDDASKSELLNMIQYTILAIIPLAIMNKISQLYVPDPDDDKGSVEILAEIILQSIGIFLGLIIISRMIQYIPTYSGDEYKSFQVTDIILIGLMIIFSLQTKLGEKVSILVERAIDLWNGDSNNKGKKKNKGKSNGQVKISQPISQGSAPVMQTPQNAMNQSLYNDGQCTSISQLPTISADPAQMQQQSQQATPDYNNMFRQDTTPLVGAATPGLGEGMSSGPVPANEGGGGAFGSAFGGGW